MPNLPQPDPEQRRWPAAPLTALIAGIGLVIVGQLMMSDQVIKLFQSGQTTGYHDTYYVISRGYYVRSYSLILFAIGGVGFIVSGLGSSRTLSIFATGFWISFLTMIGNMALIDGKLLPQPRRYIDYPDYTWWTNVAFSALSFLSLIGLALVALSLVAALGQRLFFKFK